MKRSLRPRVSSFLAPQVSINQNNFHDIIRLILKKPPILRTDEDIDNLITCTSYLTFFKNLRVHDPEDSLKSHSNGCRRLQIDTFNKGDIIFKHGDSPLFFYIVIKGEIGVFVPRPRKSLIQEIELVESIVEDMRQNKMVQLESKDLEYLAVSKPELQCIVEKNGMHRYKSIDLESVRYTDSYLESHLGGLNYSRLSNDSGLFNQRNVTIVLTKVQHFKLPPNHKDYAREHVWGAWSDL